ncbi:MalY/PatB family protein [Streptomyces sp. NPDC054794]
MPETYGSSAPVSLLDAKYPGTIGAWVAEMAFGVAEPLRHMLGEQSASGTLGYNDPHSLGLARESLTAWMDCAYGWSITPDTIAFVSDIVSGFGAVIRHFMQPGQAVVVPTPAYTPFLTVPRFFGHPVIEVPGILDEHGHRMDLAGIDEALARGGSLVVLCSPHNPTGRLYSRAELAELACIVDAHGARVFSDEVHAPLNLSDRPHLAYASLSERTAAHTITATSASKAWNISGLKCAQLIFTSETDAKTWSTVSDYYIRSVSRLGVAALPIACEHPDAQAWLADTLAQLRANNSYLADAVDTRMPGVTYAPAESTYLAWLDCRGLPVNEPAAFFRERARVALYEGAEFGTPGFVRLNFALPAERLARAVDAMSSELLKGIR